MYLYKSMPMLKNAYIFLLFIFPLVVSGAVPHADSSVLASGPWYKLAVTHTGIYQITYADLQRMGIDLSTLEVDKIRLFGNGSGMLAEGNSTLRIDDLREIAIKVADGDDERFDANDFILFYGEGADKWSFDKLTRFYAHQRNLYSDSTYYFLNFGQAMGKRVQPMHTGTAPANTFSNSYDDFDVHDFDQQNLIRSGREWYGESFSSVKAEWVFPYNYPDIDTTVPLRLKWNIAANASVPSYFYLSRPETALDSLKIDSTDPKEFTRAARSKFKITTTSKPKPDQTVTLTYNMPMATAKGWLNYLQLSFRRYLSWVAPQMLFRDVNTIGAGKIAEFSIKNVNATLNVWEVSNPSQVRVAETTLADGMLKFKCTTDSLREFIAFDGSFYYPVIWSGGVQNQNLHAVEPASLIIVVHPLFLAQAEQLGEFHRERSKLTVNVVTTTQVFNEFSCGQADPTAIRDFVKMLYERGTSDSRPKYLLLFGDGSYDPKNRIPGNNNLIPTFQSVESLNSTTSYVTDDFFGIMTENGGQEANGKIDIGIGRFPVSTTQEAQTMVDKIIRYSSTEYPVRPDWRNTITFVADDENQNLHLHQAEELCEIVATKYPLININKIFLDAYPLIKIPGGERFPDANRAINVAVDKGSLIVNYTGHGGETGWSFEQVLTTADILAWTNKDRLPVFVTATCEFSRFDNPERFTAGEMLILQPNGGAIGLYSTTRLAFAGLNIMLNRSFFSHLMDKDADGQYVRMGDLIRLSKNDNNNNFQLRNFVLLGDPAQNIAFAGLNVRTLAINEQPASQPDTLLGMSTVTVKGQIEDATGIKAGNFNGVINCKVFDKPVTNSTLGNRPNGETYPETFKLQNMLIFKGDVPVDSGAFTFSFVVPRNISLQFGKGKISYSAWNDDAEASGYYDQFVIGGRDESVSPVNQGPDITLYMDDRNFISGGETGDAAILLIDLFDTNGINSLGLGIGHEIEAVLDNNRSNAMVLNDYYAPVMNSYTRGTVAYPVNGLSPGKHTLSIKAWDMYDNSSIREISFYVPTHAGLTVKNVLNAPNPMVGSTKFLFQPQLYDSGGLSVQISIYNLKGIQVRTLVQNYQDPIDNASITWDGTDSNGQVLSNGLYPYKIVFKAANGAYSETSQKLMIAR